MKILYLTLSKIDLHTQGIYSDLINALSVSHEVTLLQVCEPKDVDQTCLTEDNDVRILKVLVGELFGVNFIRKGINTVKIAPKLKAAIRDHLKTEHFDLVLYATPPITFAGVVGYVRKKYGCRSFLMLKDIFPQNAVDIGLFSKKSPIHAYFRHQEKKLYALSDVIGCMSEGNRKYLLEHNPDLDEKKVLIFPNTQKVVPLPAEEDTRESGGELKVVFGGNFGRPQAIDFLIASIGDPRVRELPVRFFFVGNGSETEKVKQAAGQLPNMEFVPFMPPEEYERFMRSCDVGLISLDHRFTIPNYPSRTLSYMSMAKPVLACTDRVTDIRELVLEQAQCGLWCASDDTEGFAECIRKLVSDPELRKTYGCNGRKYFEEHFGVERSVACIEDAMKG